MTRPPERSSLMTSLQNLGCKPKLMAPLILALASSGFGGARAVVASPAVPTSTATPTATLVPARPQLRFATPQPRGGDVVTAVPTEPPTPPIAPPAPSQPPTPGVVTIVIHEHGEGVALATPAGTPLGAAAPSPTYTVPPPVDCWPPGHCWRHR
jgi:hypothetical protein